MNKLLGVICLLILVYSSCGNTTKSRNDVDDEKVITAYAQSLPLHKLQLPPGFKISVFAEVDNARSLASSPSGIIFVGNRNGDKVYAVQDKNGDHVADKKWVIASGLNMPNGVAFHKGDLYVAEDTRILRFRNIESRLDNPGEPEIVKADFPKQNGHGWKYIAFGPDEKLYVPVGAPCNICNREEDIYASITRMNADGSNFEVYAKGVRNTVGFTWHPTTKALWFTDNGRDMLGDDIPSCELNVATKKGLHFGYPFCHEGSVPDPEFGKLRSCDEFVKPVAKLGAHVAPLGLKFYTGSAFPEEYKNKLFIAEHGSWNRTKKSGYVIKLVTLDGEQAVNQSAFISGWLDEKSQQVWGRPVDVLVHTDGSLLISDDKANVIYRVSYN
jgi:glucose/arabinose dehydrogenase